jgi:hypothetical protein
MEQPKSAAKKKGCRKVSQEKPAVYLTVAHPDYWDEEMAFFVRAWDLVLRVERADRPPSFIRLSRLSTRWGLPVGDCRTREPSHHVPRYFLISTGVARKLLTPSPSS